jgi:hypothetical protein
MRVKHTSRVILKEQAGLGKIAIHLLKVEIASHSSWDWTVPVIKRVFD